MRFCTGQTRSISCIEAIKNFVLSKTKLTFICHKTIAMFPRNEIYCRFFFQNTAKIQGEKRKQIDRMFRSDHSSVWQMQFRSRNDRNSGVPNARALPYFSVSNKQIRCDTSMDASRPRSTRSENMYQRYERHQELDWTKVFKHVKVQSLQTCQKPEWQITHLTAWGF